MELNDSMLEDKTLLTGHAWRTHIIAAVGFCLAAFGLYYETVWSMVNIWWSMETFTHGFLIFPITIWMILSRKAILAEVNPRVNYTALIAVAAAGSLWFVGRLVDVQVVQQFAFIGLIVTGIWSILGTQAARIISFPLAYLFFAVPVGEDLVPPLMEFTATFTVKLIELTGIPVFRDGLYFSLPSGDWSVVKACSGIRYLIASVTLGCLYAYLTYQSLGKRLIFIGLSFIVPIIANGFRAYIIVMLGHMSDMTIATGVDHLIYGWIFFGFIMLILFWMGSKWSDPEPTAATLGTVKNKAGSLAGGSRGVNLAVVLTLSTAMVWPLLVQVITSQGSSIPQVELTLTNNPSDWQVREDARWQWRPMLLGADKRIDRFFQSGDQWVLLSVGQYLKQQQGAEMVSFKNRLLDPKLSGWRRGKLGERQIQFGDNTLDVIETKLSGAGKKLLVFSWYRIETSYTANPYIAKIYEAIQKLTFGKRGATKIVMAIEYEDDADSARTNLAHFVNSVIPGVEQALDRVTTRIE